MNLLVPWMYKRQSYKTNVLSVLSHILVLTYRPKNIKQLSEVSPCKFSLVIFNKTTCYTKKPLKIFLKFCGKNHF